MPAVSNILLFGLLLIAPAERTVRNDRFHVRMDAPPGWTLLKQNAYPSIVAVLTARSGARLTLSAERLRTGETAPAFAERNPFPDCDRERE